MSRDAAPPCSGAGLTAFVRTIVTVGIAQRLRTHTGISDLSSPFGQDQRFSKRLERERLVARVWLPKIWLPKILSFSYSGVLGPDLLVILFHLPMEFEVIHS